MSVAGHEILIDIIGFGFQVTLTCENCGEVLSPIRYILTLIQVTPLSALIHESDNGEVGAMIVVRTAFEQSLISSDEGLPFQDRLNVFHQYILLGLISIVWKYHVVAPLFNLITHNEVSANTLTVFERSIPIKFVRVVRTNSPLLLF
ncbi:hypothetical protein KBB05_01425 [Patescibacteria group bacterium]|nr:hypothetical protein [Patescibacteria group bacterium]